MQTAANYRDHIPFKINLSLIALITSLNIIQFFVLPFLLFYTLWWGLLSWIIVLFTPLHWSLIHEAIHKILSPDSKTNNYLGRFLSIQLLTTFDVVRFGHLMHHRFNRILPSEWYEADKVSLTSARTSYYYTLCIGLYLMETITPFLLAFLPKEKIKAIFDKKSRDYKGNLLPALSLAAQTFFFEKGRLTEVRIDIVWILFLLSVSFILYGRYWFVLLGFILVRGFMLSFHDNVYHYATSYKNTVPAKELKAHPVLSKFILHFNHHLSHHLSPGTPWIALPLVHRERTLPYDDYLLSALGQQMQGPLKIEKNS